MIHVRINVVLQGLLLLAHLLFAVGVAALVAEGTYGSIGAGPPSADPAEAAGEVVGHWIAIVMLPIWSVVGLVWAPLNAYGLWKLRPWARTSTMAYWIMSIFSCCCSPFGLYGLITLLRADVKALFAAPPPGGPGGYP